MKLSALPRLCVEHLEQAAIVENILLYTDKYDEEFAPHLRQFAQAVWGLLMKVLASIKCCYFSSFSQIFLFPVYYDFAPPFFFEACKNAFVFVESHVRMVVIMVVIFASVSSMFLQELDLCSPRRRQ